MSTSRYSDSLVLMWRLADFEARQLEAELIEPAHLLLGICKSVDVDLTTVVSIAGSLAERDEALEDLLREVRRLRRIFGNCGMDARGFRKAYRDQLGQSVSVSNATTLLHRSESSHELFKAAEQLAAGRRVFPVHLLCPVLKVADPVRDEVLGAQEVRFDVLSQASELEMLAAQSADDDPGRSLLN